MMKIMTVVGHLGVEEPFLVDRAARKMSLSWRGACRVDGEEFDMYTCERSLFLSSVCRSAVERTLPSFFHAAPKI